MNQVHPAAKAAKLLVEQVGERLRTLHHSYRTEQVYVDC